MHFMENHFGKVGVIAGLSTFVLLVVGLRNVLGVDIEILTFVAFAVFGLIVGISCASMLFYKLRIAFPIFCVALIIAFFDMFRNYIQDIGGQGDLLGILSLLIISSFGLGISLIVQFIVTLIRKNK